MHPFTSIFPTSLLTRTEKLPNGYSFRMVRIPAGRFAMGSDEGDELSSSREQPLHKVELPTFELAEFPVTQALWRSVRFLLTKESTPVFALSRDESFFRGSSLPVNQISWTEAANFCQAISLITNRNYRLPSEAEWEYAATCGKSGVRYAGSKYLGEVGWYHENCSAAMAVGLRYPNDWGLYDMSGNVWECCADHWHDNYDGAPVDSSPWLEDGISISRLCRSGAWFGDILSCRSKHRGGFRPGDRGAGLGFRLAADLG